MTTAAPALVVDGPRIAAAHADLADARRALQAAGTALDAAAQRPEGKRRAWRALVGQVEHLSGLRDQARNDLERAVRAANPGVTEARLNNLLREL